MGYKNKEKQKRPQPPAPPTRPPVSPVSLTILYYELRKDWPVPPSRRWTIYATTMVSWLTRCVSRTMRRPCCSRKRQRRQCKKGKMKGEAAVEVAAQAAQVEEEKKGKMKEAAREQIAASDVKIAAWEDEKSVQREQITALIEENLEQRQQIADLKDQITSLNREKASMRSTLSSLKALFKRKLLESFRVKVARMFPEAVWNGSVPEIRWWRTFIQDPRSIAALSSASGIAFDMPDACTDELRPRLSSIQQAGGVAAHVITEEPEVYATLVCQYAGASLERMKKIYRLVFGRDAAQDAFGDVGCCKCPVHCPEVE
ncbi:hypothetical protein SELMODRAFT_407776 [Selaginella moellendorffii]|uniref:Uncharacterized protein n=1 Tax=Selaginella moellendorffii TaxID=88036 RepID=D8R6Q2_SELML|nr:hypothetical protein SELMODRAFT_407776 [Selaginella moellendorffii]